MSIVTTITVVNQTAITTQALTLTTVSTGFTVNQGEGGGGGVTDHGALTGLADDDHAQYHNNARGDARYAALAHVQAISTVTGLQAALDGKFDDPIGDITQYIAGDGSLVAFPVAGQAGSLVRQVRNETGATIAKGSVVYISGASGNKPLIIKAIANSSATSDKTYGLAQADIATNQNGYVVIGGDLSGLDTSAFTDGAALFLSPSVAGAITITEPVAPLHSVFIGIVSRAHATQGQIDISIQNGYELEDLHNVLITSATDNDVIYRHAASGLWKNKQLSQSDIAGLVSAIAGKQPSSADLSAIDALVDTDGFLKKAAADTWALDTNTYYLASNPNGYTTNTGTVTNFTFTNGGGFTGSVATGGTTPALSITLQTASTSQAGQLSSSDWNTFNGKAGLASPIFTGQPKISDPAPRLRMQDTDNLGATMANFIDFWDSAGASIGSIGYSSNNGVLSINNSAGAIALPANTTIGNVSNTELSYLDGATSAIQGQLDQKYRQDVMWCRDYIVNSVTTLPILQADGTALPTMYGGGLGGLYELQVTGFTMGASIVTKTIAKFYYDGTNWQVTQLYNLGQTSNHPIFLISGGVPAINIQHTDTHTVRISHEVGTFQNNLKTVNGSSLIGSGNVVISGGSSTVIPNRLRPRESFDFFTTNVVAGFMLGGAFSSGDNGFVAPASLSSGGHHGVVRIRCSATANSGYKYASTDTMVLSGNEQIDGVFKTPTALLATGIVRFGFLDTGTATAVTDGCYINMDGSGQITGVNYNNTATSATAVITTLAADTWYHFRVLVNSNATSIQYTVYSDTGTQIATAALTTNIPASTRTTGAGFVAHSTGTTAADIINVDLIELSFGSTDQVNRGART